jgi:Holliday junction DNA helicase RuvA
MFARLHGTVFEKHPNLVILEAGGVGYEVHIPVSTFTRLPDTGSTASLRIHTHIREDAILLYGFSTVDEKSIFEKLITVAGIGPKVALTALSSVAPADLVAAIRSSDIAQLTRIPGVGKKTAERMVIELRDKFDGTVAGASKPTEVTAAPMLSDIDIDLISALVNLGSPRAAAEAAVRKARMAVAGENFEQLFRQAMDFIR